MQTGNRITLGNQKNVVHYVGKTLKDANREINLIIAELESLKDKYVALLSRVVILSVIHKDDLSAFRVDFDKWLVNLDLTPDQIKRVREVMAEC